MRVGSLFSGIGGFDLGLERAGFTIEWQVENNEYCRQVLQKHWPKVPCHYDITTIDWRYIPRVDLVCGGFPCQPFSCAGKRQGAKDDRYLWPEVVRCLETLRPTWGLFENVPGLLHLGFEQVCLDLEALGCQVAVLGIPACAVDAPHIRKRIWIVSHHASATFPDAEGIGRQQGYSNGRRSSKGTGATEEWTGFTDFRGWSPEPAICRMVDGIPNQSHRLKGLGNAVVPQIAEAIGKMILNVHYKWRTS